MPDIVGTHFSFSVHPRAEANCKQSHAENSDHRDCAAADARLRAAIPATTAAGAAQLA